MKLSYLSYFFTYETHIPDGIGFALFGPWHLLWLSVIFAICVRYVWIYKKGDERKKRRMDGLTACSLVVWIVVRAIYIAVIHEAFLYELPFHLCSMAGILCAVHCLTKWKWLGRCCIPSVSREQCWHFYFQTGTFIRSFISLHWKAFCFIWELYCMWQENLHPMKSDRILQNSGRWGYF